MSRSVFNQSLKVKTNFPNESKSNQLISLFIKNSVNKKFKSLLKNVRNNFGMVTCIGSDNFYVFTRQMLLHLDFNKAVNLSQQDDLCPQQIYRSQQFKKQNVGIQGDQLHNQRKHSIDDQLQTSFVKANSEDIRQLLNTQIHQIESEYELGHNQTIDKQLQIPHFKKNNSSFVLDKPPKLRKANDDQKKQIQKNYIEKNQQTQSYTQNSRSKKYDDQNFQKDVEQFKQLTEKESIVQQRRKNRFFKNPQKNQVQKNDFLRIYNSKQIGTDKQKKPIEWIYCQVKDINATNIQSIYLVSSTVLFELPFSIQPSKQQFQRQIKDYLQFFREIQTQINKFDDSNSDMPQIIVVCPIEDSQAMESRKATLNGIFNQLQDFYLPQNRKNFNYFQSPYNQLSNLQSPSKSKLPPTPKRMPMCHKLPQSSATGFKRKIRLQFRIISQQLQKSGVLRQNYSRMRQITGLGREIFNGQRVKTIGGNWTSSDCYVKLLQAISHKISTIEVQEFYECWESIFSQFLRQNMQQAVLKYQEKVKELIVGKTLVSQSRLLQVHEAVKKQTLRQFSQKKIGTNKVLIQSNVSIKSSLKLPSIVNLTHSREISISKKLLSSRRQLIPLSSNYEHQMQEQDLIDLVSSRIQSLKDEIQSKNKEESMKWQRKFLQNQYQLIRSKIKTNQIKSLANYKHQLQYLRDIFKKKLQNYSALEYELMEEFESFMFQNTFVGVNSLFQKELQEWRQKLKKQTLIRQQVQNQIKQLRKSYLTKQRSLIQQNIQAQNKLAEIQTSLQTLAKQVQIKNKQISDLRVQSQEKTAELQSKCSQKIDTSKCQLQEARKQTLKKVQDLLYLQSQLQKEQLLHQQTHQNYEQILLSYKNNVSQLQKKLKQLKQKVQTKQQKIKNQILNELMSEQVQRIQAEANQRNLAAQRNLLIKTKQMYDLKNRLEQQLEEQKQVIRHFQQQQSQSQIQRKLLEQQLIEIQSRLPRYKANQIQVQKLQKQKEQIMFKIQSISSTNALLEQKYEFACQQLYQTKNKTNEAFNNSIIQLEEQITQLKQQASQLNQQINHQKQQTSQLMSQITQLKQQAIQSEQQITHLKQQTNQLKQQVSNLKLQPIQSKQQITLLKQQTIKNTLKNSLLEQQNNQLKQQVSQLNQQTSQLTQQISQLTQQTSRLTQQISQLTQQTMQSVEQIGQLKSQIGQLKDKNQAFKKRLYQTKEHHQSQTIVSGNQIFKKQSCKNCKQNKLKLNQARLIVQSLHQDYQNIKKTYYKASCFHCNQNNKYDHK